MKLAALMAPRSLALTGANDWTLQIETDGYDDPRFLPGALRYGDLDGFARLVPAERLFLTDTPPSAAEIVARLRRIP